MNFANLKRGSEFDKLKKQMESIKSPSEPGGKDDPRFWQPTVDKVGNGMAIIRFLSAPAVDGDDGVPWVRVFKHGFQDVGGWLIETCPTTLGVGTKCPVCEQNTVLWQSGVEANKEIARKRKRKVTYIANIYVVSDPSNPENEGQIKLFTFGAKIFTKLEEAMNPAFADEVPINPFDFWAGANFKLKMRNVEGYRNYDKSEFEKPSALLDNDEKLEELWKKEYSLKEFIDPAIFKSYDQIKTRLDLVLGVRGSYIPSVTAENMTITNFDKKEPTHTNQTSSDDEEMDYFKSLAGDDEVPF